MALGIHLVQAIGPSVNALQCLTGKVDYTISISNQVLRIIKNAVKSDVKTGRI